MSNGKRGYLQIRSLMLGIITIIFAIYILYNSRARITGMRWFQVNMKYAILNLIFSFICIFGGIVSIRNLETNKGIGIAGIISGSIGFSITLILMAISTRF
jgi:hypothetical protein